MAGSFGAHLMLLGIDYHLVNLGVKIQEILTANISIFVISMGVPICGCYDIHLSTNYLLSVPGVMRQVGNWVHNNPTFPDR